MPARPRSSLQQLPFDLQGRNFVEGCSSSPASSQLVTRAKEDGSDALGLAAVKMEKEECSRDAEVDSNKECLGCIRSAATGTSFFSTVPVSWALPSTRGLWCKDCFNCWRLMYASRCTLVVFGVWLKSASNWQSWELTLRANRYTYICYCWLRFLAIADEIAVYISHDVSKTRPVSFLTR